MKKLALLVLSAVFVMGCDMGKDGEEGGIFEELKEKAAEYKEKIMEKADEMKDKAEEMMDEHGDMIDKGSDMMEEHHEDMMNDEE